MNFMILSVKLKQVSGTWPDTLMQGRVLDPQDGGRGRRECGEAELK